MPSALSVDLRERVIEAVEAGSSRRQAAERFGVGKASAIRWHARFRDAGVKRHWNGTPDRLPIGTPS